MAFWSRCSLTVMYEMRNHSPVHRKGKHHHPASRLNFQKVPLQLLYSWSYEQWDSQSKRAQDTISEMGGGGGDDGTGHIFCQSPSHIYNFESCPFNCRQLFFLATFPHWNKSGAWQAVWKIRDFFVFLLLMFSLNLFISWLVIRTCSIW